MPIAIFVIGNRLWIPKFEFVIKYNEIHYNKGKS